MSLDDEGMTGTRVRGVPSQNRVPEVWDGHLSPSIASLSLPANMTRQLR
jgi:hypothetical protein